MVLSCEREFFVKGKQQSEFTEMNLSTLISGLLEVDTWSLLSESEQAQYIIKPLLLSYYAYLEPIIGLHAWLHMQ